MFLKKGKFFLIHLNKISSSKLIHACWQILFLPIIPSSEGPTIRLIPMSRLLLKGEKPANEDC